MEYIAAHRTLIPEVERLIVDLGVCGVLSRERGRVRGGRPAEALSGFVPKIECLIASFPEPTQERLVKLRDHWKSHMNTARHGESDSKWTPPLLTADAIFMMLACLNLPVEDFSKDFLGEGDLSELESEQET